MIVQAETAAQIEAARTLFREYETWSELDLCFQNFEAELAGLPGKYAAPSGRLLLALVNDNYAGCVALRKFDENSCEMKRLFVRVAFRGSGIGQQLIEKIIEEAALIGHQRMLLDTLPGKMSKAIELYKSSGFREIAPYYNNPYSGVLFMEKNLK